MKKIIFAAICTSSFTVSFAQEADDNTTTTLWTAPKAACDAYNADKNASQDNSGTIKPASDKDETIGRDLIMPIICNPPTIKTTSTDSPDF